MNNTVDINFDGINVYAFFSVKPNKVRMTILSIIIIVIVIALITGISFIRKSEITMFIFPIIIITFIAVILPLRILLWGVFGKETLIINTKTISFNYDYGIIRTNLKTIHHNNLATSFVPQRNENNKKVGYLAFYNYREKDNLPELIHQTTILIESDKIEEIVSRIQKLFYSEYVDNIDYIDYNDYTKN